MEPLIRAGPPGERGREILRRDAGVISPSAAREYPLVLERGAGMNLWDIDGNRYLDFTAGIAVMNMGWNPPEVVAAIREQAGYLSHGAFMDFCSGVPVRCAEEVVGFLPGGLDRVYFSNSGAESVEAAMKLARYHSGRNHFIAFHRGFHGRTYGALSLTAGKVVQRRSFGPFLPVIHVPYPDPYRPFGGDPATCDAAVVAYLEETVFADEVAPDEVAAIVVEPVLGEGGYVVPPPGFLPRLRRLCDEHGILLVADEVQAGCFRTGRFLASTHAGVTPDIVCLGKALGGGLPFGVTVASGEVMDWPPGSHASTFGGNNLACAAALAVMGLLREEGLGERVTAAGGYLTARLRELAERHPIVGDVRGLGLMVGMELVRDQSTKEPARDKQRIILRRAFERGLVLLPAGESVIRFCPPLIVSEEEIDTAVAILDRAMEGF
jgi:4-aminobutyrate aminotransferase